MNHFRFIAQDENSDCGLACLGMIASHYGHQVDLPELRRRFAVGTDGSTLRQLIDYAARLHLSCRALRIDLSALGHLRLPCILHWELNHFVVMKKVKKNTRGKILVTIFDPAVGERTLKMESVSMCFTGVALELLPTSDFAPRDDRRTISIKQLSGPIIGFRRALFKLAAITLGLQTLVICTPLFNQFIIDEVITSGDRELLTVMVLGLALAIIIQTVLSLGRSWLIIRWHVDISLQWGTRVFSHLCHLPFLYFQKRTLGDIASRFGSLATIQGSLSGLFAENILDAVMAVLALGMMLLYSAKLTLAVVIAMAAYLLLRLIFYQPFREASRERLVLSAKENSFFLETVRAHLPVKLFGQEAQRSARWLNLKQDVLNRETATQKLTILFKLASTTIFSTQALLLFYMGATMVIENILTVGMLMAFISYATTFSQKILTMTDLAISIKLLDVHTQRLADIVTEPAEPRPDLQANWKNLKGTLTIRNLRFRYAEHDLR